MRRLILHRLEERKDRTFGILHIYSSFVLLKSFYTLELPWRGNRHQQSCIPAGEYTAEPRYSERFGDHIIINDVPNRDLILIHNGNYPSQTQGCILIGSGFKDINNDEIPDVINSKPSLALLTQLIPDKVRFTVVAV